LKVAWLVFEFLTKLVRNYIAGNDQVKVYLGAGGRICRSSRRGAPGNWHIDDFE